MSKLHMRIYLAPMAGLLASVITMSAVAAPPPHADFDGVWQVEGVTTAVRTTDGKEPPLRPDAKAKYEERRASFKKGDKRFDPTQQCQPHGVPRLLYEPMPFEIMVQPTQVLLMHQWNRLVRWVDLDKPHSEALGPTFLGQSVGHWDGNTLVIDTNAFNDSTLLDAQGMPHSDQLHVIERYTLDKSGNKLNATVAVEDPQTFSQPWETKVSFKRLRNTKIEEDVCVERLNLDQYK